MAQVRERLGRQILGTSVAGAPQRIDPLDRLLMLRHMRSKALVAVKPHERLFGGEVHLGKIDELVEGGGERQLIGPGAEFACGEASPLDGGILAFAGPRLPEVGLSPLYLRRPDAEVPTTRKSTLLQPRLARLDRS